MRFVNLCKEQNKLFMDECEIPSQKKENRLIKVASFGINRAELMIRAGKYPLPKNFSSINGLEAAGYLVDLDGTITDQRVMAITEGGSYAEYVQVHQSHLMPVPENVDMRVAGAIPEVFLTAFQLLRYVKKSDNLFPEANVLVHGAASGVGTTLIQMLNKIYKANSIALCGSENKVAILKDLGAGLVVLRTKENKNDIIKDYLGGLPNRKLNAVLDHVGKAEFHNNLHLLGADGTFVNYSALSGPKVENVDLREMLSKRVSLFFTTLAARSTDYKAQLVKELNEEVTEYLRREEMKVVVHKR
eukprot:CAMPEP_0170521568 /NCGR_PEP_ID=MMETSP0209-20121228/6957_1 /TAXON_ID=665100 ORGANISM="Litonotus pictus, Strain P1" /NCGR_SAMPLE_ID=MMETSP0209 /ASSEMBLY_ACC=CAM_ASM_000301 /LENGTH=301 /DNA_ID=CAMNT_0010808531 /DNA_START=40 /DNA_END=942 /DNA_ORIENTATION=-